MKVKAHSKFGFQTGHPNQIAGFLKQLLPERQGLAESNQIFTGSIDGVDNMLVKNFDCCFLRQILTTVMLKIEKYGLRVLI